MAGKSTSLTFDLFAKDSASSTLSKFAKNVDTTGKKVTSGLTDPLDRAGTAAKGLGTDVTTAAGDITKGLDKTGKAAKGLGDDFKTGSKKAADSLDKASTAVKGLGTDFDTEMRQIAKRIGMTDKEIDQFTRDVKDIKVKVGFDDSEAESGMDGFFSDFKSKAAVGGAAAGAAAVAAFMDAISTEADVDRVVAQLGLSKKQSERLGEVSGRLFASNWADSVGEAALGVGAVESSIQGMRTAGVKDLERISGKALAFADLFEVDVARGAQVAGQMIRTGLAKNADQAFDLLFKSSQKVPAAVREDLLDALDEYGPFFEALGMNGKQAFGLLVEGSKKGMFGIDKAGDAIKEFTIRATDGSDLSQQAFEAVGLDAEKMTDKILAGGDTANKAFGKIIQGLLDIEDPSDRANTAIKLFGTPMEDLSVSEIPRFLRGLRDGGREMRNFAGTADKSMTQMSDNVASDLKTMANKVRLGAQDIVAGFLAGDWDRMGDGVEKVFGGIEALFEKHWRQIAGIFGLGTGKLVELVHDNWDDITGFFKDGWDKITGFFSGGWKKVKEITTDALDKITGYFKDTPIDQIVRDLMNLIPNLVKKGIGKAKDLVFDGLKWIGNKIKDVDWLKVLGKIWDGIKKAAGAAWNWLKEKVTETIGDIAQKIRDINWGEVFGHLWDGIKKVFRVAVKAIFGIVRNWVADIVDKFLSFASTFLETADKAFGWIPGVGDKLDDAKEAFADFREDVNNQIRGVDSEHTTKFKVISDKDYKHIVDKSIPGMTLGIGMAEGGPVRGGQRGKDSVPLVGMPDEHMWTTSEVRNAGGHGAMFQLRGMAESGALKQLLDMGVPRLAKGGPVERSKGVYPKVTGTKETVGQFRAIRQDVNDLIRNQLILVKRSLLFAGGGVGAALKWARQQVGDDYQMGGVGPSVWDCSGFMSGITNFLRGNPLHSRVGSTADFPWPGFVPGADPSGFTIGSTPSYPGSSLGHMAGTLGGVNVESSGGVGVRVGRGARGYNDPGFTQVYHLRPGQIKSRGGGADTGALSRGEKWIIRKEAGGLFNVRADNPISTAWGLGQLLEANRVKFARQLGFPVGVERGDEGGTNRDRQIAMFRAYYRDRYGNIDNAVSFHRSHGWYGDGLVGGIFTKPTVIGVGDKGPERVDVTPLRGGRRGGQSKRLEFVITNWHSGEGYIRGISREEIEDEFNYQAGG